MSVTYNNLLQQQGIPAATVAQTQAQPQQTAYDTGGTLGALGNVLSNFYMGNQYNQGLSASNSAIDQQIASLQDMYNPNGTVAQQYAQELAAKDAAAGRNSQYGARSAQLQALLAKGATQNAGTIASLAQQKNQGNLAQTQMQAQQLASLFNLANQTGATQWANNGLKGLFNSPTTTTGINPISSSDNAFLKSDAGYGDTGQSSSYTGGFSTTQPTDNSLGSGQYGMQSSNTMQPPQQWGSGAGTNFLNTNDLSGSSGDWFPS
jgi:hypothetical protein